jgi:hypothetical protein
VTRAIVSRSRASIIGALDRDILVSSTDLTLARNSQPSAAEASDRDHFLP